MKYLSTAAIIFLVVFLGCSSKNTRVNQVENIIPKPQSAVLKNGYFTINSETKIIFDTKLKSIEKNAKYLQERLKASAGLNLESTESSKSAQNFIHFKFDENIKNEEGYKLVVDENGITINASNSVGAFYGIQTVFQMLPPQIFSNETSDFSLSIPAVEIEDAPRFKWRGVHFDVGRHFHTKENIKKMIDYLAYHKMRQFHWHLTEDQGWRIEIKKYPKLTEVGAYRKETMGDGKPHGGFYTQEDVKEIVKYAEDRFITIVPEIELPGHSLAALAAYPEYACTKGPFEVATRFGVHKDVFCAGNEKTFEFFEDVLSEVIELFPSEYIHIGGDECPKDRWEKCRKCQQRIKREGLKNEHELQSYFIKRIEKFLTSKNKKLIGWDEILEGGLAKTATVMSWRGIEGGITAAKQRNDVIMTPVSHCYFDYYQGNPELEPKAHGGYTTISKVYSYEPIPEELSKEEGKYVLGTQANLWSEYMPVFTHVEYMLFPRLAALSEVCWTKAELKDLPNFIKRLDTQLNRYEAMGINYAKSSFNVTIGTEFNLEKNLLDIELTTEFDGAEIYYTLDGTVPDTKSIKYSAPFNIKSSQEVKAVSYRDGKLMSEVSSKNLMIHKAFGKSVELTHKPADKYSEGGKYGLVDGLFGTKSFSAGGWQGFQENDVEAVIDLGEPTEITKISSSFLQKANSWVFMPKYVEYSFSSDGKTFSDKVKIENDIPNTNQDIVFKKLTSEFENTKVRYIKVFAKNIETLPDWHMSAGGKAWIFIDEIIVE